MADSNEITAAPRTVGPAVVSHNVVSLYAEPDTAQLQTSQLTLNAPVQVLEYAADRDGGSEMARIIGEDRYEGWLRSVYLAPFQDYSDHPTTTIASLIADVHSSPSGTSQILTKLTVATKVVLGRQATGRDYTPILLPDGITGFTHRGNLSSTYESALNAVPSEETAGETLSSILRTSALPRLMEIVVESALRFVGTPYLWGGSTPFGIDCSGLVQLAYKIGGIQLLRDAWMQMDDRRFVSVEEGTSMADAQYAPGDLIFFTSRDPNARRSIGHVGLAIGDGSFVHAAGGGRGVIVTQCDSLRWTKRYAAARRLSPDADLAIDAA